MKIHKFTKLEIFVIILIITVVSTVVFQRIHGGLPKHGKKIVVPESR